MNHPLDILTKIQKVDAPPFLYTRILNRIQNKVTETIPLKWAITLAASLVVLISINTGVMIMAKESTASSANLSEVFSLQTNNSLYNE